MPFSMKKQTLDEFFNGVYKDVVMEDLHKCSNLPYFEGNWEAPMKSGKYDLNMCQFSVDNWPDNMPPGYYRLVIDIFDESDAIIATATVTVQLESSVGMGK